MTCSVSACPPLSFALSANFCTMFVCVCVCATAASTTASPERRRLSASTASKPSASDIIGQGVYDVLKMYFVMTVEVDANGPFVKVIDDKSFVTITVGFVYVCVCVCVCVF